jgi:predicted MFS family arabinose efflux permease
MASVMAVAMVAGPLVGGYITDNLSWRWAFYVNLPIGAIALVLVTSRLHLPKKRTEHRIDWSGSALLAIAITSLVLLTTWGGTQYGWGSWQIMALAAIAVIAIVFFAFVEPRAAEPVLSLGLFKNRNFALVSAIGFLTGFAMFGVLSFLPLYQQTVQGASATNSGLLLLPMMAGLLVTSLAAGTLITRTGRYRAFPIAGGVIMTIGMILLSRVGIDTTKTMSAIFMVVLGLGMGFLMQTTMLIAQNSVEQKDIGVASSAATFFRSIGGSFGVALFGAIFNHRLFSYLVDVGQRPLAQAVKAGGANSLGSASRAALPHPLIAGIATATSTIFFWSIFLAAVVPVLAVFIKHITLRGANDPADATAEVPELQPVE